MYEEIILDDAIIYIESKINENKYYMFEDKVVVVNQSEIVKSISKPNDNAIASFYDIYYIGNQLSVIFAAYRGYDLVYTLDETELTIQKRGFQK